MKWFKFARWHPTEEIMQYGEPLAFGYIEITKWRKYIDLNHDGRIKWFEYQKCLAKPSTKTTCTRSGSSW